MGLLLPLVRWFGHNAFDNVSLTVMTYVGGGFYLFQEYYRTRAANDIARVAHDALDQQPVFFLILTFIS